VGVAAGDGVAVSDSSSAPGAKGRMPSPWAGFADPFDSGRAPRGRPQVTYAISRRPSGDDRYLRAADGWSRREAATRKVGIFARHASLSSYSATGNTPGRPWNVTRSEHRIIHVYDPTMIDTINGC
jgi:hypothetical protein